MGSPDYFDRNSFENYGIESPYINPRTGDNNQYSFHPTTGGEFNIFDLSFVAVETIIYTSVRFVF